MCARLLDGVPHGQPIAYHAGCRCRKCRYNYRATRVVRLDWERYTDKLMRSVTKEPFIVDIHGVGKVEI